MLQPCLENRIGHSHHKKQLISLTCRPSNKPMNSLDVPFLQLGCKIKTYFPFTIEIVVTPGPPKARLSKTPASALGPWMVLPTDGAPPGLPKPRCGLEPGGHLPSDLLVSKQTLRRIINNENSIPSCESPCSAHRACS